MKQAWWFSKGTVTFTPDPVPPQTTVIPQNNRAKIEPWFHYFSFPFCVQAPSRQVMNYWLQQLQQKRWEFCNMSGHRDSWCSPTPFFPHTGLVAKDAGEIYGEVSRLWRTHKALKERTIKISCWPWPLFIWGFFAVVVLSTCSLLILVMWGESKIINVHDSSGHVTLF